MNNNNAITEWVMSDATTPAERIAFLHWQQYICLLKGNQPSGDAATQIGIAFDQLESDEQQLLIALSERAPQEIGFTKFMAPTPGARPARD